MKKSDLEALARGLAPVMAELVERELAPLRQRLAELEGRGLEYSGTHQRAQSYRRGSAVTHDGSLYIATRDVQPGETPGKSDAWQLAVKRGKDAAR